MSQIINTNIASLNAQRNLSNSQNALQVSLQRLSSGLRINSAKDDAAGLAITDRMSAQVRGLNQAVRNANDGISIMQTAEGALSEITNALQRMRELAVQSANDTNSASDRASLQKEIAQLQQEITRIATQTQFNGKGLLDGTFTSQRFQVGAYAEQAISFSIGNAKATSIGSNRLVANGTLNQAQAAAASLPSNPVGASEDLTVSGSLGTTTVTINGGESARSIAIAVNAATASTGVEATALTQAKITVSTAATVNFNLYGANSTAVAISANVASTSDLTSLADAINAKASSTGITATLSSDRSAITLSSAEGYDIQIENASNGTAASNVMTVQGMDAEGNLTGTVQTLVDSGADSTRVGGTVNFNSANSFTVTSGAAGGIFNSTSANSSTLSAVASINVGTQSGANSALKVIDGALAFIADQRAALGAMQNRFSSAIANLEVNAENVSAARSRIMDADFAAETAAMTRAQILQQAGVAILAQANALPQQVLALLRG